MQFLFKYIDDLVGKGLDAFVIVKLIFWSSFSFVPMALPLAILISSIMTFGSLGEHYELVAFKSAGISLQRILKPMIVLVFFICIGAFFFSNRVIPFSNLKMSSLLYDVRQQKPGFAIKEGVFYNGFEGYSIRVGRKAKDNQTLYDLMIYNHTDGNGNMNVLIAESGKMYKSSDEQFLVIKLFNGESYQEMSGKSNAYDRRQHMRVKFKEHELKFDLSTFKLSRTNEDLFKDHYSMLNLGQLMDGEDTLQRELVKQKRSLKLSLMPYFQYNDTSKHWEKVKARVKNFKQEVLIKNFPANKRAQILSRASGTIRNVKNYVESAAGDQGSKNELIRRFQIEWHRKFTLSVACLILFFIGAPLGSIIRKGGLGVPIVISIFFFIFFHIISTSGEKYVREGVLPAFQGMWLASVVLAPIGIFLMRRATSDSALFDMDVYTSFFRRIFKRRRS